MSSRSTARGLATAPASLGKACLCRETKLAASPAELVPSREHRVRIVRRKGLVALVVEGELPCLVRDDECEEIDFAPEAARSIYDER